MFTILYCMYLLRACYLGKRGKGGGEEGKGSEKGTTPLFTLMEELREELDGRTHFPLFPPKIDPPRSQIWFVKKTIASSYFFSLPSIIPFLIGKQHYGTLSSLPSQQGLLSLSSSSSQVNIALKSW